MNRRDLFRGLLGAAVTAVARHLPMPPLPKFDAADVSFESNYNLGRGVLYVWTNKEGVWTSLQEEGEWREIGSTEEIKVRYST